MRMLLRASALSLLGITGCATPAIDPVQETLDERTGATVTHLAAPLTFVATTARGAGADPFAFMGPFETNHMGKRRMHLWFAVPADTADTGRLVLRHADAALVEVGAAVETAEVALESVPYRTSATWQRQYLAPLDAALLERLASSGSLVIEMRYANGALETFANEKPVSLSLQEFRARLGL